MSVSRRRFIELAGCVAATAAMTSACSCADPNAGVNFLTQLFGSKPEPATKADCLSALFDQIIADRTDIRLYTWQDARSGSYGYGGAEFPKGSYFPHSIYVGDIDDDGWPELLYLAAHQDHGTMLGCRLKLFKFDESSRDCRMVFSSPTFPDPLPSCSWQPGDSSDNAPWVRPEVCWDRIDTSEYPGTTDFILFTVAGQTGVYALIISSSPAARSRYLVHMAYDKDLDALVTVEDPWVEFTSPGDYANAEHWHGTSPVTTEEYQQAEDWAFQNAQSIITFNGSGNGFSAQLEPKLTGEGVLTGKRGARGRQAMSLGVALASLGAELGKRAVFVGDGDAELLPYDVTDLVQDRSPFVYQPKLAHTLIALACAAYSKDDVVDSLVSLGCTEDLRAFNYYDDPLDPAYGPDQVACAIGLSQTDDGNPLVFIVLRGSYPEVKIGDPLPPDWTSNLNLGETWDHEGEHAGFSAAADEVYEYLDQNFRMPYELAGETTTIVICGHSRGAAVGNLLARRLLETWANTAKLYCYNFSCPDSARYANYDWLRGDTFKGVFNVSDALDLVSWIPGIFAPILKGVLGKGLSFDLTDMFATWGKFGESRWFENESPSEDSGGFFSAHAQKNVLAYLSTLPELSDLMKATEVPQHLMEKLREKYDELDDELKDMIIRAILS